MRRYLSTLCISLAAVLCFTFLAPTAATVYASSSANCGQSSSGFLGFPTWYKYLSPTYYASDPDGDGPLIAGCNLDVKFPESIPKILLAVVEIALRIGALVAVGYIVYGGFKFILSNGEPDRAAGARSTIINAIVGLVIAILATGIVSFIGGTIK